MAQTRLPAARMPLPSKIAWDWGITANYIRIPQPRMGFYWKMPADAACLFSINVDVPEKRRYKHGKVPPRLSKAWKDDAVRSMATILRSLHGEKTKTIVRPTVWDDLYHFFDAVDLWTNGAWNLWRVLQLICDENEGPSPQSRLDAAAVNEIEDWAYDWCTHEQNRIRLGCWDQISDILHVISPADTKDLDGCGPEVLNVLRSALMYWHPMYKISSQQRVGHTANVERVDNQDTLPAETQDDINISPSRPSARSIAPEGRPRRRSNSMPPSPTNLQGENITNETAPVKYTSNPAVVIVNGTDHLHAQRQPSGPDSTKAITREPVRKGHQPSKSGPVPAILAGHLLATRGAGVEASGPSRLPSRQQQPPSQPDVAAQQRHLSNAAPAPTAAQNAVPQHPPVQSQVPENGHLCRNRHTLGYGQHVNVTFVHCPCHRCTEMSRSVHAGPITPIDGVSSNQMNGALVEYFSQWGLVESFVIKTSNRRFTCYGFARYASEESAQRAVKAHKGPGTINHPHLRGARVTHPFFSKFYVHYQRVRGSSNGSHPPMGNGSSPPGGNGRFHPQGRRDSRPPHPNHQQPRQQIGTPQRPVASSQYQSPSVSSTMVTTPSARMSQQGYPHSSHSGSPPHGHGPWIGHYPHNGFQPPPPFHHGPPPPHFVPSYPPHGWPDMPMPPGPMPAYPPYPAHMPTPPAFNLPQGGPQGFPLPPDHFASHPPHGQNPPPQGLFQIRPVSENNAVAPTAQDEHRIREPSMQTKPPSDKAAFDDDLPPSRSSESSTHSSTGSMSMSIRVRLPDAPTPEPKEAPVLMPTRESSGLPLDSPVRRITFGDFVPAQTPGAPAARAPEPTSPAPRPVTRKTKQGGSEPAAAQPEQQVTVDLAEPTPVQQPMDGQRHASHNPALLSVEEEVPTQDAFGWQTDTLRERRISGDIRLDPDYNATVIRRPRRTQHGRIPWNENHGNSFSGSWNGSEGPYPIVSSQHPGGEMFWQPPHGVPYQPVNGGPHPPYQPSNGEPYPQFNGAFVHPPNNVSPPLNSAYPPPQNGISPPLSSTYLQPPNSFSPPPNSASTQPSNDTSQQPSEAGSSKPKPKKKFKNKKKNKSALSSHANSRSATPFPPPANGDATHEVAQQSVPGPSNPANGNTKETGDTKENGNHKENGKAPARPTTPVPTAYIGTTADDDIYNATPWRKNKKGKGKAPPAPGPEQAPGPA